MNFPVPLRGSISKVLLGAALFVAGSAPAEELTLQDGKKITGTIVGFENGMFKVETEFGFALIRKDKVQSIDFGKAAPKTEASKESPNPTKAVSDSAIAPAPVVAAAPKPAPPPPKPAAPPPPPVSRPLNEPLPAEIRERVEGTTYFNDTFQFSLYKPPGWKIHEGAPSETGRAIVALGPEDERTLLFVDRQVWSGTPDLKSDSIEANLRRTYQNYQMLSEDSLQVDHHPAMRREFTGVLDGAEWRGVSVRVAQGHRVFGLVGLTSAETLQFHQAVLNKIIASFRFLGGDDPSPAAR